MPWVVQKSSKCPSYKPWAVINKQSGAKEGCHPSKEAATQQQKALYAKEPQMNSADDCECQERATKYAMADGSFPIERCTGEDSVASAAKLAHHSKTYSFDEVKRHVMKAKDALGCPDSVLPATWNQNSAESEGTERADSPPADVHAPDRGHNEHDVGFLYQMSAHLQGAIGSANQVLHQGIHPDTAGLARDLIATHADHLAAVSRLQQRLGPATTAGTVSGAGVSSGHGQGVGDGGGRSGFQVVRSALAVPQQERDAREIARSGEQIRAVQFEAIPHSDGLTLEGYAAVFNSPTRIDSWEGEFDETIEPGAFAQTLRGKPPVLMFEHGKHPLLGSMPLGVIQRAEEDSRGVYIQARLSDNWLIQPVRDAVRDGAITGMSFRFGVPEGGDKWADRKGDVPLRTLLNVDVRELGPVVFPAYEPTTAAVRSALDHLSDLTGRSDAWSADGGVLRRRSGNGQTASQSLSTLQHARDRELRIRGIIRG